MYATSYEALDLPALVFVGRLSFLNGQQFGTCAQMAEQTACKQHIIFTRFATGNTHQSLFHTCAGVCRQEQMVIAITKDLFCDLHALNRPPADDHQINRIMLN